MKYLLLTEYFPESEQAELTGGVECRCFNLVKQLAKVHEVIVLCSHQPEQPRVSEIAGVKVIRCGPTMPYSGKGDIIKRFMFSYALYSTGKKLGASKSASFTPNIVEGASFLCYPPAYFLGKKFKAKKVATWHETWIGSWIKNKGMITGLFGELWERFSLRLNWDKIISVSTFTKDKLIAGGISPSKISVVYNGITLTKLKPIKVEKHSLPTICYFGRLMPGKNLNILLRALAVVKPEIPGIKCKFIGTGPTLNSLKRLTAKLNLTSDVEFVGYVKNHEELLRKAKKCHLFVHPSTIEGFGITVLEAAALGLPYVVTDIKPFLEVTKNGLGGEIFKRNKAVDLAQKIKLLLTNKRLYRQKIKEGQLLAKDYDWEDIFSNYFQKIVQDNIPDKVKSVKGASL